MSQNTNAYIEPATIHLSADRSDDIPVLAVFEGTAGVAPTGSSAYVDPAPASSHSYPSLGGNSTSGDYSHSTSNNPFATSGETNSSRTSNNPFASESVNSNFDPLAGDSTRSNYNSAAETADSKLSSTADSAKSTYNSAADSANANVASAKSNINSAADSANAKISSTVDSAKTTASSAKANISNSATNISNATSDYASGAVTGLRQRVNSLGSQLDAASDHPAVKNAKGAAQQQVGHLREVLGRSPLVRDLEKRTGVDRVFLVVGGVLAYLLLIPLNLFGLALPTTTLLTLIPPAFLALGILEEPQTEKSDAATRALLSYFVSLGFIQFLESLAAGVLERRIPQYYTLKLVFLAYLLHPRTQGAINLHQNVFRPLLARAQAPTSASTPPQSKEFGSTASSPTFQAQSTGGSVHLPSGGGTGVGLDVPKGATATINITQGSDGLHVSSSQ